MDRQHSPDVDADRLGPATDDRPAATRRRLLAVTALGALLPPAPARTPPAVVQRLPGAVQEAAAAPRVQAVDRTLGLAKRPWAAEEFERLDRESRPRWIELAREPRLTLGFWRLS
jgi:hypothetical protein